jgi:sugar phosphate isomerase/epimerase
MLRRQELMATGLDLWIPCEHFLDETTVDRAIAAIEAGCELAADLGLSTLSVQLPASDTVEETVIEAMVTAANRHGVTLADHRVDGDLPVAKGLDPAACLSSDRDPVEMLLAIGPALAAARLSDLSMTGLRTPAGSTEGRLDVAAYQAAVTTLTQAGVVALDLRQLTSPWQAAAAGRLAWERAAALWA